MRGEVTIGSSRPIDPARDIGMVFQQPPCSNGGAVDRQRAAAGEILGLPVTEPRAARELLALVGLKGQGEVSPMSSPAACSSVPRSRAPSFTIPS